MTMQALIAEVGTYGPFASIQTLADRYRCDDIEFPFGVIGSATIGDWVDPPPSIEAAMRAKLEALEVFGLGIEQGGVTVNGVFYDTDDKTQAKYTSAYALAQSSMSPASFTWWMSDGFRSIPKATLLADIPVVAHWVEQVYANIGVHYQAILALETVEAVAAYDFTTGWPTGT